MEEKAAVDALFDEAIRTGTIFGYNGEPKDAYCNALSAKGIIVNPSYNAMPHTYDWFRKRYVFGRSGGLP